jgi:hypothetical protein
MTLHASTFEYLKPTDEQMQTMSVVREEFASFASKLNLMIVDGPDKTYLMRQLRDCAMWANIAITRNPDGSPRT